MDKNDKVIENFELVLKKQTFRKASALYINSIQSNIQTHKPQDVIASVSMQLKAIQSADCIKNAKSVVKEFNKSRNSNFLPLNKLPIYEEVTKQKLINTNKFETQCVSDTELINIIDDAEALIDTHNGMTQEFETTFCNQLAENEENVNSDSRKDNFVNAPLFITNEDVSDEKLKDSKNIEFEKCNIFHKNKNHLIGDKEILNCVPIEDSKMIEKHTTGLHKSIMSSIDQIAITQCNESNFNNTNEKVAYDDTEILNTERSPSPVLNNIKIVKSILKSPSPLVFNLETFENFERIAIPIIEENINIDTAKHVINSQLLGNELYLEVDPHSDFNVNERNHSPIFEDKQDQQSGNKNIQNNILDEEEYINEETHNSNVIITENFVDNLRDEILFSSDEEGNINEELQDLPFTCALKTSFYDHSDVLDKTMYVGFQTASNKSIQICAESFVKAKSILNDVDNVRHRELSLTELVHECDNIKLKHYEVFDKECVIANEQVINKSSIKLREKINKNTVNNELEHTKNEFENKSNDTWVNSYKERNDEIRTCYSTVAKNYKSPEKPSFKGFMTANNKKIKLSDKALDTCKKIFHDIDLEEKCNMESVLTERNSMNKEAESTFVNIDEMDNPTRAPYNTVDTTETLIQTNINDENIIQEFENIEMSLEDDNDETEERPLHFARFKTASNKNIKNSDFTISKTKNIFQDFTEILDKTKQDESYKVNKPPLKSSNANEAVRQNYRMDNCLNLESNQQVDSNLIGFNTASNKRITISEQALAKTKDVFHDIDCIELTIPNTNGLRNANTKLTSIEKPLAQTNPTSDRLNRPSTSKTLFVGFQTVNNNEIKMSKEALSKTKDIFKDIDTEKVTLDKNNEHIFQGFKTASNKQVKISTAAMLKSTKIFEDLEMANHDNNQTHKQSSTPFGGFRTANKKPVNISAQALAKSKKLFEDVPVTNNRDSPNCSHNNETSMPFKGFHTASNKPVTVTAEALARSRKVFQDLDDIQTENLPTESPKLSNTLPTEGPSSFRGFQTASKKKVELSKEALAKTSKLFDDIDGIEKGVSSFKGFQTASNKRVSISEHALIKSRQVFQDIDFNEQNDEVVKNITNIEEEANFNIKKVENKIDTMQDSTNVFGFKTGTNHNVKVSEDALKTSRKLLSVSDKERKAISDGEEENLHPDSVINTQILNNFDQTLCTEDFHVTTPRNKRSGSPILSCPTARKRKKFEPPYRNGQKEIMETIKKGDFVLKNENIIKFDENYKKNKSLSLKDLTKFEKTNKTDPVIINMGFDDLLKYHFIDERNDLIDGTLTIGELKKLFVDSVDRKLIPDGWLDNHLKLIIWKLLSYEIKFPNTLNIVCTAKNVIEQLKYRYRRELYNAERPALRKILERDDTSAKTLILCVVNIYDDGVSVDSVTNTTNNRELLLTDGWYCIKASTDKMLGKLVSERKIVVGSKIVTNGAELVNCEQGMAPWENTASVRLKLFGNSTRRARWDARLGYHGDGSILSQLSAVKVDGGKVSKLRVYVTRVYPTLYVEKLEDGSTVTRSERLEHLHEMKYESERQILLERLYEDVEKEFSDQESQDSEGTLDCSNKRKCMDTGSQIAKFMKKSRDPAEFRACLTSPQTVLLQEHTDRCREKLLQDIQLRIQGKMEKNRLFAARNVVPLMRIRVAAARETRTGVQVTKGMMSVWKPNDAVSELITEGAWIDVMNVVPTAIRYSEIQISAGRQSVFSKSKYKQSEKIVPYMKTLNRKCYHIKDLAQNPWMTTDYNEIDTVGFVFLIEPSAQNFETIKNQPFQNAYLTDADKNIICVNFWGGIKKFGFGNVLDTGQVVACANLQKRAGNTRKNIPQYRVTEFSYFTKAPKNETAKVMMDEFNRKITGLDRRKFCDECVAVKKDYSAFKYHVTENLSPHILNNSDYNLMKNKMFIDSPLGIQNSKCEDFNLTGLDFESTFKQTATQDLSPRTLLRKRRVNERISKLKMYGEPPPLSTVHIIHKSKNARKSYISPLILKSQVFDSVATSNNLPESPKTTIEVNKSDIESSPVMSMNTTYIKRSNINPVVLNFSRNAAMSENDVSDVIDHFSDDFDGSPPLSLD